MEKEEAGGPAMTDTSIEIDPGFTMDADRRRELRTVQHMIRLYCRKKHRSPSLCTECSQLLQYVERRLQRCCHQDDKPACRNCTVHCFREPYRTMIRKVMKFSGPRLLWRHPILALLHLLQ